MIDFSFEKRKNFPFNPIYYSFIRAEPLFLVHGYAGNKTTAAKNMDFIIPSYSIKTCFVCGPKCDNNVKQSDS
jgi:hypothetical protein